MNLTTHLLELQQQINFFLEQSLPKPRSFSLYDAMYYCVFNGGKRFRPLLVYLVGEALELPHTKLNPIACAIELIHCYSLVHDDLPAMDNSDLRRGLATCHKKYDEATAILTGDALGTLAYEIIAKSCDLNANEKIIILQQLALHSGAEGMIKGQVLDLAAIHKKLSLEELSEICLHKTGKLLQASVQLPGLIKGLSQNEIEKLEKFSRYLGLAYQIQDDLLDIESTTETLGKPAGIDQVNFKNTFPHIAGIKEAKNKLAELKKAALTTLNEFSFNTTPLHAFTNYIFNRSY